MSKFIDLIGEKFGKLIVTKRIPNGKNERLKWLCKCNCGKEMVAFGYNLQSGNTRSCGCLVTKHGYSQNSRTYKSWQQMKQRCYNPNYKGYHNYGGRGIKIYERWRKSFINFLEDMGECPPGLTIERIKNNKGYYKSNCKWATRKEQNQNKRNNYLITFGGKTQCIATWANETGISESTIRRRLKNNWTPNKILTTPVRKYKKRDNEYAR